MAYCLLSAGAQRISLVTFPLGILILSNQCKYLVRMDALIATDIHRGVVDKLEARTLSEAASTQIHDQRQKHRRNVFDKAGGSVIIIINR